MNDIAILDVTGVESFPVVSYRENNLKLFHFCNVNISVTIVVKIIFPSN